MVLRTAVTKQICVAFVVEIIQPVQIVKERLDLGLSTIDHVVSYYALFQLVALYIEGYLNHVVKHGREHGQKLAPCARS